MKQKKQLVDKINYENGATLLVFKDKTIKYFPSKKWTELRKRLVISKPIEERVKKWEANRLLFEEKKYPLGDAFIDKLLLILQGRQDSL